MCILRISVVRSTCVVLLGRVVLLADAMVVPARTLGDAESAGQGTVRTACIHATANENVTRLCLYGARCTMARGARRR